MITNDGLGSGLEVDALCEWFEAITDFSELFIWATLVFGISSLAKVGSVLNSWSGTDSSSGYQRVLVMSVTPRLSLG